MSSCPESYYPWSTWPSAEQAALLLAHSPGSTCRAAMVVAHPDDETLWGGGLILSRPDWRWFVAGLCRRSDPDRAPRFHRALERLGASGALADVDDGPEQHPLSPQHVEQAILELLPSWRFEHVVTHGPMGEYTRHRRHEEVCRAVVALWKQGRITTRRLWMFAYEDGDGRYPPRASADATTRLTLNSQWWKDKREIITDVYGFADEAWETLAAPALEAFQCFDQPQAAEQFLLERAPKP